MGEFPERGGDPAWPGLALRACQPMRGNCSDRLVGGIAPNYGIRMVPIDRKAIEMVPDGGKFGVMGGNLATGLERQTQICPGG